MGEWESNGRSDEWFTPAHVFDALGCTFDLDVATANNPHVSVPARGQIFSRSLESQWLGFIWMNPPFGGRNAVVPWLNKFFAYGNGIALTPDRTSAPWFQTAWQKTDLALFTPKLKFIRPDGTTGGSPANGTCLWAVGEQGCNALRLAAANGLGILATPAKAMSARQGQDRDGLGATPASAVANGDLPTLPHDRKDSKKGVSRG